MSTEEIKNNILQFLKKHKLCTVSTIDSKHNKPESAVVAFCEKENLEIYFGTSNTTRKYKNIETNAHVAFVIGWDPAQGTVQYEGVARELSGDEMKEAASRMIEKNPGSAKFSQRPDQRYFVIQPTWIRFVDMSIHPDATHELAF